MEAVTSKTRQDESEGQDSATNSHLFQDLEKKEKKKGDGQIRLKPIWEGRRRFLGEKEGGK